VRALLCLLCLSLLGCPPKSHRGPQADDGAMAMAEVQIGDTLDWLAYHYEVPGGWPALARLNSIPDPDLIFIGDHIRIPRTGPATAGLPPWPLMLDAGEPLRACQVERESPQPAQLPGCNSAACVSIDGGRQRVCSCDAQQGTPGFLLLEGGRPTLAWPAPVEGSAGNDPSAIRGTARDFDLVGADLDGDGRREWVVAFRRELNDLGMSQWNLAVLSGAQPAAQPLLFTAANYGEGSLIRRRDGAGCDLLSTTWERAWEPGPLNDGWTLLGRPMRYQAGALAPLPDRPIHARRLYYSFEPGSMPLPSGLVVGTPAHDLGHKNAYARWAEPMADGERVSEEEGTITGANPSLDGELGVTQHLVLATTYGVRDLEWSADDGYVGYAALGHRPSGRLYPPGYRPSTQRFVGKTASLNAHALGWGDLRRIAWVDP
jgi:hypothetical protein